MLGRRRRPVPPEVDFLDDGRWHDFTRLVDAELRRIGGRRDGLDVRFGDDHVVALGNLARACAALDRSDWSVEIRRFLRSLAPTGEPSPLELILADPDAALARIRVRPYAEDLFAGVPFGVLHRPLAGELVEVLCLDLDETVAIVNDEMAAALGRPEVELFALGRDNVRRDGAPESVEHLDVRDGVTLDVLTSESFYTGAWLAMLDEVEPALSAPLTDDGALAVVPYRHQVAVHVLRAGPGAAVAPGLLLQFAHLGHRDGVGPVSPQLLWWRPGRLDHLPGAWHPDGVRFEPTDEYLEVVERLVGTG